MIGGDEYIRLDRNIRNPELAVKQLKENRILADLLENNVKIEKTSFGAFNSYYSNRMFFALRNGEHEANRIEFYCMGAKYCDLVYQDNDYQIKVNQTYAGSMDQKEDRLKSIQLKNFHCSRSHYERLYDSLFYALNPLCGRYDSIYLIDAEVGFTRSGIDDSSFIDLAFLVIVGGIPNLLFVENKRAMNQENIKKENETGSKPCSKTYQRLVDYKKMLTKDRANVLEQYNHVIDFYNSLGCNLPKLSLDSTITLGLMVFYHNRETEIKRKQSVIAEAKRAGFPTREVEVKWFGNKETNQIDECLENRAISAVMEMAKGL